MHEMIQEAIRVCMEINNAYHTPEELRALIQPLPIRHMHNQVVVMRIGLFTLCFV